jgi:glycosyltransferase involved in cell wall biosynthesis
MLWDKGISEFVDSARILASQGRSIEFLLAGEPDTGNPASIPISTLQSWRDEGCVNWLGHVDDMPALFRSVDIVVLPSYREGLPKGLIEAAAAERALIATDVPGCREVVQHEQTGLLVPVKNAHALAAAIARLHEEPALRRQIGKAARVRALAVFDESHILRQTLSAYYELTRKGLDCPVERHE